MLVNTAAAPAVDLADIKVHDISVQGCGGALATVEDTINPIKVKGNFWGQ